MANLKIGSKLTGLDVYLTPGYDFRFGLRPEEADGTLTTWPAGVTLELKIGAMVFPATMTPEEATWLIDAGDVDAALAQSDLTATLVHVEPGGTVDNVVRLPMYRGRAISNG